MCLRIDHLPRNLTVLDDGRRNVGRHLATAPQGVQVFPALIDPARLTTETVVTDCVGASMHNDGFDAEDSSVLSLTARHKPALSESARLARKARTRRRGTRHVRPRTPSGPPHLRDVTSVSIQ